MAVDTNTRPQTLLSRRLSIGFALAAVVLGAVALYRANHYPRTDDAVADHRPDVGAGDGRYFTVPVDPAGHQLLRALRG